MELINDILDLSTIEAGMLELREGPLDIVQVADDAVRLMEPIAQSAGIAISTGLDRSMPSLYADERRVKQIFLNLLGNALKFTPRDGTVRLFANTNDDGTVVIGVSDTGVGMSADDIPKALEPFHQIDRGEIGTHDGSGLGLPLSRRLAELHGGTLEIESELGAGTTVTVRFPPERVSRDVLTG